MIPIPKTTPPPVIKRISLKDWLKGTVTAFDDGRTPVNGLRASGNVILDQDGTVRPRPSLIRYGTQPLGTVLGEIYEFVQVSGATTVNWMGCVQNVAGVSKFYISKDGGAWQICNGKSYDNTAKVHFCQADNKVLIMNGVDNLSYFDVTTAGGANTVVPFVALTTPGAPTIVRTGMVGTTYTYYYKITANSTVGETAASPSTSQQVLIQREAWDNVTNFLTINWSAVSGATSYNVYVGSVSGSEVLVASGVNGLSYKDDGSAATDVTHLAPAGDTTAGPKVTRASFINGQVFLVGDADNPRYVRFGGTTATAIMDFSPFNGGGYVELGRGSKELPVRVMSFRDGRGNASITVLCKGTNGSGKRYLLTPDSTTIGDTIISFFDVVEDNGQDGTNSPDAVILYKDSLWYPSLDGFKTTGTKPQLQNILSTNTVSETIINDIKNLNTKYMDGAVGNAFQGKLRFALPVGSTTNNEIWVLDLDRGGPWMKPWNISASWLMLYNDNSGLTHDIVLSNNVIYEMSYSQATNDDGIAFSTNITSGLLKFSEDSLDWAKVIDITFILLRPQGTISFAVSGKTEDAAIQGLGSQSFSATSSVAGWGEAGWSGSPDLVVPQVFGWSNFEQVPVAFGNAQSLITIEVDEELEWLSWELDSAGTGVDYQLADVIVRYVVIGVKDLT